MKEESINRYRDRKKTGLSPDGNSYRGRLPLNDKRKLHLKKNAKHNKRESQRTGEGKEKTGVRKGGRERKAVRLISIRNGRRIFYSLGVNSAVPGNQSKQGKGGGRGARLLGTGERGEKEKEAA